MIPLSTDNIILLSHTLNLLFVNRDIKMVTLLGLHIRYLDTTWPRGHSVFVSYDVLQLESLVGHR